MLVIGHAVAEVLVDVAPILEDTCRACGEEASGGGSNLAVRLDYCAPQEPQNNPVAVSPYPRCRISRNDQVRTKVNDLLATGASYAMVLRALGDDNAKLEKGDH